MREQCQGVVSEDGHAFATPQSYSCHAASVPHADSTECDLRLAQQTGGRYSDSLVHCIGDTRYLNGARCLIQFDQYLTLLPPPSQPLLQAMASLLLVL
jgi:hypothetical protein